MTPDHIALGHTSELDRVYPPMRWTAVWSTGDNFPLGRSMSQAMRDTLRRIFGTVPDFLDPGLYLISDEGHTHEVDGLGRECDGVVVITWNRREAEARLRLALTCD